MPHPCKGTDGDTVPKGCSHLGLHLSVGAHYKVILGGDHSFSPLHLNRGVSFAVWLLIAVLTCGLLIESDLRCSVVLHLRFGWDFENGSLDYFQSSIPCSYCLLLLLLNQNQALLQSGGSRFILYEL